MKWLIPVALVGASLAGFYAGYKTTQISQENSPGYSSPSSSSLELPEEPVSTMLERVPTLEITNDQRPKEEEGYSLQERDQYLRTHAIFILDRAIKTKRFFHETGRLEDGTPVGNLGSLSYILDEDGEPISPGFQEINPTENRYIGELGTSLYRLDKKGNVLANQDEQNLSRYGEERDFDESLAVKRLMEKHNIK